MRLSGKAAIVTGGAGGQTLMVDGGTIKLR